jgi:hypothetical protein
MMISKSPLYRRFVVIATYPWGRDTHRHLLLNEDGELNVEELLGSEKGIDRLAEFLEETDAYAKH